MVNAMMHIQYPGLFLLSLNALVHLLSFDGIRIKYLTLYACHGDYSMRDQIKPARHLIGSY